MVMMTLALGKGAACPNPTPLETSTNVTEQLPWALLITSISTWRIAAVPRDPKYWAPLL